MIQLSLPAWLCSRVLGALAEHGHNRSPQFGRLIIPPRGVLLSAQQDAGVAGEVGADELTECLVQQTGACE